MSQSIIPILREQMRLAGTLAKGQIAFVVMPAIDDDDMNSLMEQQQTRLERMIDQAEKKESS